MRSAIIALMGRTLIFLAALLVLACQSEQITADDFSDYTGWELYKRFCASCHGPEGFGDGPVASAVAVTVPDLTRISQRHGDKFPEEKLREIIDGRSVVVAHGTRYMPVWGYEFWIEEGADVEAEKGTRAIIDKLVNYLRGIQR